MSTNHFSKRQLKNTCPSIRLGFIFTTTVEVVNAVALGVGGWGEVGAGEVGGGGRDRFPLSQSCPTNDWEIGCFSVDSARCVGSRTGWPGIRLL